ncbi:hypothetical protein COY17_00140 [Candidatus Saccharibacteria bacterium CG_4_10_14_0_2_um_filter_52_9]|nr:MAG: hypothetical protein COY17_00140 [Candidatus Saccharibacteria bacterium CG_4_10_14_0_2_um_filter_52_9]
MNYSPGFSDPKGLPEPLRRQANRKSGRHTSRVDRFGNPEEEVVIRPSVVGGRREVGPNDAVRLKTLISTALAGIEYTEIENATIIAKPGVSIASSKDSYRIFNSLLGDTPGFGEIRRYNNAAGQAINKISEDHLISFAKLGEICMFGAPPREYGARFIAATLEDDESNELLTSHRCDYLRAVTHGRFIEIDEGPKEYIPHISLVKTECESTANIVEAALQEAEISGIWVSLRPIVPTYFEIG